MTAVKPGHAETLDGRLADLAVSAQWSDLQDVAAMQSARFVASVVLHLGDWTGLREAPDLGAFTSAVTA